MKQIMLIGIGILIALVGGCDVYNNQFGYNGQSSEMRLAYFESCLSNPDGYWNGDAQICESRYDKLQANFGDDHCVELKELEKTELIRGTNYVIYVKDDKYTLADFQLESENNLSESQYIRGYTLWVNYSVCKGTMRFLDVYSRAWYEYRLTMPYCDNNNNISFYICEEGNTPPTDNQPPEVINVQITPTPFSGEEELSPREPFSIEVSVPQGGAYSIYTLLIEEDRKHQGVWANATAGYQFIDIYSPVDQTTRRYTIERGYTIEEANSLGTIILYGMENGCIHQTNKLIPIYNSSGQIIEIVEKTEWDNSACSDIVYTLRFYD